jgi:CRISPR/Cas system-associated exonuclease Cas4 (RecB family)
MDFAPVKLKYAPYSASKLLVARCPARFQSKYIQRDKIVADSLNSARGSVIHEVLQKITEHHIARTEITPRQVEQWIEESIGRNPAAYEQIKLVKESALAYIGNVSPYLTKETYCEKELAVQMFEEKTFLDNQVPIFKYVQVPYQVEGRQNPLAFFGAKLDQLCLDHGNRIVTIVDHKSTPSSNKNSDHDFQLGCYAWLTFLLYPGYTIRTVLHFAHPRLNFYSAPTYWSEEDIREVEEEIRMRARAIESFQEYPALPGSPCDYCHMTQQCPDFRQIQEQNARGDVDLNIRGVNDMVRIAKQVRVLGVVYDRLNKALKEAIESSCPEGGVAIEGYWYGFKPGESKVDWQATERRLKEAGVAKDLTTLFEKHGLEASAMKEWKDDRLKAIFKTGKDQLLEELRPFLVTEKGTRFGGHKL